MNESTGFSNKVMKNCFKSEALLYEILKGIQNGCFGH